MGRLSDRIRQLAEESPRFAADGRVLGGSDPVEALLDEIDATVLPSHVTFRAGAHRLDAIVSGRRLYRVAALEVQGALPRGVAELLGTDLSMEDADSPAAVARAVEALVAGAGLLRVEVVHAPTFDGMSDGLSIGVLRRALGREDPGAGLAPAEGFAARIAGLAVETVRVENGTVVARHGASSGLEEAAAELSAFVAERTRRCPSHADPSLTCLGMAETRDAQFTGIATFEAGPVVFRAPLSAWPRIAAAFERAL